MTGVQTCALPIYLRVTMGTLLSGEDQTNNLIMTGWGAAKVTQLVGTGGVPSTAGDATGSANLLPGSLSVRDGAAAVVLTRQSVADAKGLEPVARVLAVAAHARERR